MKGSIGEVMWGCTTQSNGKAHPCNRFGDYYEHMAIDKTPIAKKQKQKNIFFILFFCSFALAKFVYHRFRCECELLGDLFGRGSSKAQESIRAQFSSLS